MTRTRFWGLAGTLAVGALLGGVPLMTTATATQEQAAAPGVTVCVFYGICEGPSLPGR